MSFPVSPTVGQQHTFNDRIYIWTGFVWNLLAVAAEPGPTGATGVTGPAGEQGPEGPAGATGPQGPAGVDGEQGPAGATGPEGPAGADGAVGATGPEGPAGADGADGATGPEGPVGATGATGPAGTSALLAYDSVELFPAVGVVDNLYLDQSTNKLYVWRENEDESASYYIEVGGVSVGPEGPTGPEGPVGATGPAGDPGGATGPEGPAGATGATGPEGPVGATGPEGPAGVDGVEGPVGVTGATGPEGPEGPAGNDGDAGATGATGPEGPAGATGPQGPAGADGAGASTFEFDVQYTGTAPTSITNLPTGWSASISANDVTITHTQNKRINNVVYWGYTAATNLWRARYASAANELSTTADTQLTAFTIRISNTVVGTDSGGQAKVVCFF